MALNAGEKLGPYEISEAIGKGGMGEVYRARDAKLKREVAVKILPEEFSRDPERISRFQREAEALAALNHPNIASIYDLHDANAKLFLVMELVEGETLADRLSRGAMPVEEARAVAGQIVAGLEEAHGKGVMHRDLNVRVWRSTRFIRTWPSEKCITVRRRRCPGSTSAARCSSRAHRPRGRSSLPRRAPDRSRRQRP